MFKEGSSLSFHLLRLLYLTPNEATEPLQCGVSVSARHFKRAVDRNRIKRLMREAYRLQKNELKDKLKETNKQMCLFFIYTGNELPKYETIYSRMGDALTRLIKVCNEEAAVNS